MYKYTYLLLLHFTLTFHIKFMQRQEVKGQTDYIMLALKISYLSKALNTMYFDIICLLYIFFPYNFK